MGSAEDEENDRHESRLERKLKLQKLKAQASSLRLKEDVNRDDEKKPVDRQASIEVPRREETEVKKKKVCFVVDTPVDKWSHVGILEKTSSSLRLIENSPVVQEPIAQEKTQEIPNKTLEKKERSKKLRHLKAMAKSLRRSHTWSPKTSTTIITPPTSPAQPAPQSPVRRWSAAQIAQKPPSQLRLLDKEHEKMIVPPPPPPTTPSPEISYTPSQDGKSEYGEEDDDDSTASTHVLSTSSSLSSAFNLAISKYANTSGRRPESVNLPKKILP